MAAGTPRRIHSLDDSVESVCFQDGVLWSAARWDENSIAVEVREAETWKVLAREELTDPFGDSFFHIVPHPGRGRVAIWAAAGQDGQCLFWAHREGAKISIDRFPGLDETTWPVSQIRRSIPGHRRFVRAALIRFPVRAAPRHHAVARLRSNGQSNGRLCVLCG